MYDHSIRPACRQDADAIAAIWNPVITNSLATFNSQPKSVKDIEAMLDEKHASGYPFLVFEQGAVQGFATYGQFRGGVGYAKTLEHTIILAPQAQGQGAGRALMGGLCDHARAAGANSMWAGNSAVNLGGIAFHSAVGFEHVAKLPKVGYKFGQWLDLILMVNWLSQNT
jgi:L-amino acid N-acyltransferase YncA